MKPSLAPPLAAALLFSAQAASADDADEGAPFALEDGCPPMLAPLEIGLHRNPSGTAWVPDRTPMFGSHARVRCWDVMQYQNMFTGYNAQLGPRGGRGVYSTNWQMLMARRRINGAEVKLRAAWSLEPYSVGEGGYPLLFQAGGTGPDGRPLVDRMHPHDLFMELSMLVTAPLGDEVALQIYAAPAGEPALGPPAFPYRFSAMADPFAPLGHSMQDMSYISYGVLTLGLHTRRFKVEGSWFNGREPDGNRTNLDLAPPDSYAARLTVAPFPYLTMQGSTGWLKSPELARPGVSIHRTTASAMVALPFGENNHLGATAIFGQDVPSRGPTTRSLLAEATLWIAEQNEVFVRGELLERSGRQLALPEREGEVFQVRSLALGYVRSAPAIGPVVPGLGLRLAVHDVANDGLARVYGDRVPLGGMIFLRLRAPELPVPRTAL